MPRRTPEWWRLFRSFLVNSRDLLRRLLRDHNGSYRDFYHRSGYIGVWREVRNYEPDQWAMRIATRRLSRRNAMEWARVFTTELDTVRRRWTRTDHTEFLDHIDDPNQRYNYTARYAGYQYETRVMRAIIREIHETLAAMATRGMRQRAPWGMIVYDLFVPTSLPVRECALPPPNTNGEAREQP